MGPGGGASRRRPHRRPRHARRRGEEAQVSGLRAEALYLSQDGAGVGKIFPEIREVVAARRQRVPTAELNRFLHSLDLKGGTSPAGRRPKIYYMTQAAASPPTFVLFTDKVHRLHFSYERFLVNQLRKQFGFKGTPILLKLRPKKQ